MKEKLKGFYYEHKKVIDNGATIVGGLTVGYICGKAMGSIISTGFKVSYDKGLHQGYNRGCDVIVNWLLKENSNNPEVLSAVADCVTKHTK